MLYLGQQMKTVVAVLETPHDHDRSTLEVPGMAIVSRVCHYCQTPFETKNPRQVYCTPRCSGLMFRQRRGDVTYPELPSGTLGALRELLVCADLMKRGYHVYRAQSPACPCDLIAIKGDLMLRVEVKTAYRRADGSLAMPLIQPRQQGQFDVLALVGTDEVIQYVPEV